MPARGGGLSEDGLEEVSVRMKVEVVKALPMLVRLLPVLLALLILAVGVAEAGGPIMPPDFDPF
jgi:hypothetical protein